jgi:putative tryptophan/tyrosine transport system substrate-binding protein
LPVGGTSVYTLNQGAVFSYISDIFETGKLAAPLADKILKGTPAGTIPVVTPEAKLLINYKMAQELNITIPEGLLSKADKIIK